MKKLFFLAYVVAATFACLCCKTNSPSSQSSDTVAMVDGDIVSYDGIFCYEAYCLRDMQSEMAADLFKGSYDDALLDSLLPDGKTPSAINTFLLRDDEHIILVDAGLGADKGGKMLAELRQLGIRPEQVTDICLTHLHADHIGGLLNGDGATFPNATIYLSVDEFVAWADGGEMESQNELWKKVLSYYALNIQPVQDGDVIIDGCLVAHLAPGHTPGHTIYQAENMYFTGDLVHAQDLQIAHPLFCARYDNNPKTATETRIKWLDILKNGCCMCDAHCYIPFYEP